MLRLAILPLLTLASAVNLAGTAVAQIRSGMPAPLPGLPMVPPPVSHPALAAQPLIGGNEPQSAPTPAPAPAAAPAPPPPRDPALAGPQVAGKDLKKAVKKVNALKWHEDLAEARVRSAAEGKPIVWIQALGDLEGFA